MKPLFHPNTVLNTSNFIDAPSQSVLICGPVGAGKGTVASYIASEVLGVSIAKLSNHAYVKWVHDLPKGVPIEAIREAQGFMQLKTPGRQAIRRVLIVEQGNTMSTEAQNAFLKLLEEPPADSLIIITATGVDQVLPTIRSRSQILQILPPSLNQVQEYFGSQYPDASVAKAYYISEGYMGLMTALLTEDSSHPLVVQISLAKSTLGANTFERLAQVEDLTKQKNVPLFLQAMERVCHAQLNQSAKSSATTAQRWTERLKAVISARQAISLNAQPKLVLTNLMLNL